MAIFQHKSVNLAIFFTHFAKNSIGNLRCLLKNLRSLQKFYATAGCTGCDKYHVCHVAHSVLDMDIRQKFIVNGILGDNSLHYRIYSCIL